MEHELRVIETCDNCGACCLEQESPPGYMMLLNSPGMMDNEEAFKADAERLRALPAAAMAELREYLAQLLAGVERSDQVCIWLDHTSMRCRYHEHRPAICREFEIGSAECRGWRQDYGIDQ